MSEYNFVVDESFTYAFQASHAFLYRFVPSGVQWGLSMFGQVNFSRLSKFEGSKDLDEHGCRTIKKKAFVFVSLKNGVILSQFKCT